MIAPSLRPIPTVLRSARPWSKLTVATDKALVRLRVPRQREGIEHARSESRFRILRHFES